jgi:hypothetical protein
MWTQVRSIDGIECAAILQRKRYIDVRESLAGFFSSSSARSQTTANSNIAHKLVLKIGTIDHTLEEYPDERAATRQWEALTVGIPPATSAWLLASQKDTAIFMVDFQADGLKAAAKQARQAHATSITGFVPKKEEPPPDPPVEVPVELTNPAEASNSFFSGNWKMPSLLGPKRQVQPVAVAGCTENMYPAVYNTLGFVGGVPDKKPLSKSMFSAPSNWKLPTMPGSKPAPKPVLAVAGCTEGMYPAVYAMLGFTAGEPREIQFPVGSTESTEKTGAGFLASLQKTGAGFLAKATSKLPTMPGSKPAPKPVMSVAGCTEGMYPAVYAVLGFIAGEPREFQFPVGSTHKTGAGFLASLQKTGAGFLAKATSKLPTMPGSKPAPKPVMSVAGCTEGMYPAVYAVLGFIAGEPREFQFPVGSTQKTGAGFLASLQKTGAGFLAKATSKPGMSAF